MFGAINRRTNRGKTIHPYSITKKEACQMMLENGMVLGAADAWEAQFAGPDDDEEEDW